MKKFHMLDLFSDCLIIAWGANGVKCSWLKVLALCHQVWLQRRGTIDCHKAVLSSCEWPLKPISPLLKFNVGAAI